MKTPPLQPDIADVAPADSALTAYDEEHFVTYLRILDAHEEGADWRDVAQIVLQIDPERDPDRARDG
jgi:hypothetical protein